MRRRPATTHTIDDLRRLAARRVPAALFHYVDGAADSEVGLRRAREAFGDLEFRPGVLRGVEEVDTSARVLGGRSALPFGMAPTGFTRMMHPAGELAMVSAAARADIPYALSTMGTTSIGEVAVHAPSARKWFQLYLWKDRELSLRMAADAKSAGYEALLVTVDVPAQGNRLRDLRHGFTVPPRLTWRALAEGPAKWRWWFDYLTAEPLSFAFGGSGGTLSEIVAGLYDPAPIFADVERLREVWDGPLLVKGVQTVRDAEEVLDHGADGVVLSSHGGRQLDRTAPPLHLLPRVVDAVGERCTVVLDTGILHGGDVVAAMALGADFTLVGRAFLYGLLTGGEAGVERAVAILAAEVERTMRLLGVACVEELTRDHVRLLSRRGPVAYE